MLSLHRINARDRRRAAVHEAGHIVIAEQFGIGVARAAIWPTPRENARVEKTWGGQIQVFAGSESRPEAWRAIGIAGRVAEDVWFEHDDQAVDAYYWDFVFDEVAAMSTSDWQLCGAEPEIDADELSVAAAKIAGLLQGELREKLIKTARKLILEARDTSNPINGRKCKGTK